VDRFHLKVRPSLVSTLIDGAVDGRPRGALDKGLARGVVEAGRFAFSTRGLAGDAGADRLAEGFDALWRDLWAQTLG